MNWFTSAVTAFCVSSVFIGVIYIICPDGVMNKIVKYVLSLCFLATLIVSVNVFAKNDSFHIEINEHILADTENLDITSAKYIYSYALQKEGINFKEIEILTDKAEDGSIVINKIIVNSDCREEEITNALGEAAKNFEVVVINE
ncbi:MAG: hypothetical protein E7560_00730 [Ruminococcaceae bacterium]|nr:hypothetical protein [Oscillospiraceae bacterium]